MLIRSVSSDCLLLRICSSQHELETSADEKWLHDESAWWDQCETIDEVVSSHVDVGGVHGWPGLPWTKCTSGSRRRTSHATSSASEHVLSFAEAFLRSHTSHKETEESKRLDTAQPILREPVTSIFSLLRLHLVFPNHDYFGLTCC